MPNRAGIFPWLLFTLLPFYVRAQDSCEAPVRIHLNTNYTGLSTCGRQNGVAGFGPIASPYPDYIFSFTAQDANATIALATAAPLLVYLLDSCANGAGGSPIDGGTSTTPMDVYGLTNGRQYWIVVSTQPTQGDPTTCGDFSITFGGRLPVALKSFSID